MRRRGLFMLVLLNVFLLQSQNIRVKTPLSSTAFDSLIIGELNFMVLGDDNVKQGISYEYKENNSELNVSGKLYSKNSFIMTVDGKFSVDNGAFIFDETDGSKKGKLTTNFFFTFGGNSKSYSIAGNTPNDLDSRRAMLQNKIQSRAMADSIYYNIMDCQAILGLLGIHYVSITKSKFKEQRELLTKIADIKTYNFTLSAYTSDNKERLLKKLRNYYKRHPAIVNYDALVGLLDQEVKQAYDIMYTKNNAEATLTTYKIPANFKIEKLLKDYQEAYTKLENYSTENNKLEIPIFKKYWTASKSNFFGVSPFYERQGFDIYTPTADTTVTFKNRFTEIRSDLFGINVSWNYICMWKSKSFLLIRPMIALGRSNNFTEYDKNEYSYTSSSENVNGVPINVTKTKTGYLNKEGRPYEYGTFTNSNLEIYFAPIPVAGIFGKIGYLKNDALLQEEAYPLETGILINLKSKDKKNIIAIQLFMSRLNLNVHPDDDMNFGLKIGLPITIAKN